MVIISIENSFCHLSFKESPPSESDKVQKIIEMIGRNGDLRKIRIFSKNGTILKSDNRKEIGKIIDSIFIHSVKDRDTTLFHEAYSI